MKTLEVYDAGSTLVINGSNTTGMVEKVIISANHSVSYQLTCYVPERHPEVVQDYEISPVEGKVKKYGIGFNNTPLNPPQKEVTILVDEDNIILDIDASDDILINTNMIDKEEYAKALMDSELNTDDKNIKGSYETEIETPSKIEE